MIPYQELREEARSHEDRTPVLEVEAEGHLDQLFDAEV